MRSIRFSAASLALICALFSGSALAEGDAAKGKKVFNKCKACHSLKAGKKKIGPSLHGVFGRVSGTVEGFKYSKAMMEAAIEWDETTLDEYLTKPKKFVPGTKMVFVGLKKAPDRENLITYLKDATQ